MALIATQKIVPGGLTPTYSAVAASDTFVPGPTTFLHVKNAGGSPDVVNIVTPNLYGGLAIADAGASVPATTGDKMFGPFPPQDYSNSAGLVDVTHTFTTTVTCAVVSF